MPRQAGSPIISSTCTSSSSFQWLASANNISRGSPISLRLGSLMYPQVFSIRRGPFSSLGLRCVVTSFT
ncbi:hypothetical protein K523DRAFT_141584 [Schizophyllum commune Tattone D]|nr:hypothetical protein K523DRAFT_141584 [Schizophyllum commune Tattone D]